MLEIPEHNKTYTQASRIHPNHCYLVCEEHVCSVCHNIYWGKMLLHWKWQAGFDKGDISENAAYILN